MTDVHHFTTEQIASALAEAKQLVTEAELPAEIEGQAILWAAQKLSEKTIVQADFGLVPVQGRIQ